MLDISFKGPFALRDTKFLCRQKCMTTRKSDKNPLLSSSANRTLRRLFSGVNFCYHFFRSKGIWSSTHWEFTKEHNNRWGKDNVYSPLKGKMQQLFISKSIWYCQLLKTKQQNELQFTGMHHLCAVLMSVFPQFIPFQKDRASTYISDSWDVEGQCLPNVKRLTSIVSFSRFEV